MLLSASSTFAALLCLALRRLARFATPLRRDHFLRDQAWLAVAIALVSCSHEAPLGASPIAATASRVLQTTRKTTTRLVALQTKKSTVVTTRDHPFARVDSGWAPAADLAVGDRIHILGSAEGTTLLGKNFHGVPPTAVYNLTVDRTHSYFVGSQGLLVHNVGCFRWLKRKSDEPQSRFSPDGSPRRDGPLALGLSPRGNGLSHFAKQVGATTYWEIFPSRVPVLPPHMIATRLNSLLESAESLHFNLTGMIGGGRTLEQALESGAQGLREGNWTNWELYQVLGNPNLLRKTRFYLDGAPYTIPPELIARVQSERE